MTGIAGVDMHRLVAEVNPRGSLEPALEEEVPSEVLEILVSSMVVEKPVFLEE